MKTLLISDIKFLKAPSTLLTDYQFIPSPQQLLWQEMVINYSEANGKNISDVLQKKIIPEYRNIFGQNKKTFFQGAMIKYDTFSNKVSTYNSGPRTNQNSG